MAESALPPRIMLASGNWFDLLDPWNSVFTIEDIAHGLSNICRYAGQCRKFYSVAEHSVLVSSVVQECKLEALLHDATEAFLGDITRPLKQLLPCYGELEKRIETVIFERFGLDLKARREIAAVDLSVLAAEQALMMPKGTDAWAIKAGIVPAEIRIRYLSPGKARSSFMQRFKHLCDHIRHKDDAAAAA